MARANPPVTDEDQHRRFALLYGHCHEAHLSSWLVDFVVVGAVVFYRSSTIDVELGITFKTVLTVIPLAGALAYLVRVRPFDPPVTAAYSLGLGSLIFSLGSRALGSCRYHGAHEWENDPVADDALPPSLASRPSAAGLAILDLLCVSLFLAAMACLVLGARRSIKAKGQVIFDATAYQAFEDQPGAASGRKAGQARTEDDGEGLLHNPAPELEED